ncbi:alpha/beta hydrolase family protein [Alcaligenes sp. WGS1538]|uniref:alpha/beta hydrolase family protein n=1 Tax=Alcaligenes sp. WGS1538 TaxID=3366811 RepID=UPI00372D375C
MSEMTLLSYGASHEQQVEWFESASAGRVRGLAMLVHGGFWRGRFNAGMMHPMVQDLLADGWAVANIEYRRGGCGGQWPVILEDVQLAMRQCRSRWEGRDGPCIGIGHSVGGELVLLAEKEQDAVVALSPVTDVPRTQREGLGEDAAVEFFGATAEQAPDVYRQASPLALLPLHWPVLLVHGDQDERVPVEHSRDYVRQAGGVHLDYREWPGLNHMDMIDPAAEHWADVKRWMQEQAAHRS